MNPSAPDTFTLGLVQMRCEADPEANLEKTITAIHKAAEAARKSSACRNYSARIIFASARIRTCSIWPNRFPARQPSAWRRQRPRRKASWLRRYSSAGRGVYHNTAAVFDADGSLCGLYRKMHIPDDPHYYEKYYFTPGDLGFRTFETRFARLGVLVCWDQWFPEAARLTAMQGAEVLIYPTAIGWHPREKEQYGVAQHDAWETIQRGMRSPMAFMWRRSIALVTKGRSVAASNFGANRL